MATRMVPDTRRHLAGLRRSSELSQYSRDLVRPSAMKVSPKSVIRALNAVGVRPVLMGAYGLTSWRGSRATEDVDVLVRKKDIAKSVRALEQRFPKLLVRDTPVVVRFIDPAQDMSVIDVMKPTQRVFQIVFRHTIRVGDSHDIPELEMAMITKFAAMTSPHRQRLSKAQDAVDFMHIVARNRDTMDRAKLLRLANSVYPDGGNEIMAIIEKVIAGEKFEI